MKHVKFATCSRQYYLVARSSTQISSFWYVVVRCTEYYRAVRSSTLQYVPEQCSMQQCSEEWPTVVRSAVHSIGQLNHISVMLLTWEALRATHEPCGDVRKEYAAARCRSFWYRLVHSSMMKCGVAPCGTQYRALYWTSFIVLSQC